MLWIETGLVMFALLIAMTYPSLGSRACEAIERQFAELAKRRTFSVVIIFLAALGLRAALLPIEPKPDPVVHDEFGYLLAADTFAHGRLTNPTHPMWKHFETFAILQKPTYQCFAQPAQGMALALGQVLFGHPFWGVWLSCGLMCAAITWMLQGWLTPEWALLGGILAILRFGGFGYWANSYWGGAVGAWGGAMVLGALPRIKRAQRVRDALLMAFGLVILANSRPYEGFVFSIPIAIALFAWMLGSNRGNFRVSLVRVILPAVLVLAVAAVGMGYYCWRVTGSPFRMAYSVERQDYAVVPYFLWQPLRPRPVYYDSVIEREYTGEEVSGYNFFRSPAGVLAKLFWWWRFYLGPALTFPLFMLLFILPYGFSWRDIHGNTRFLLLLLAVSLIALELETFFGPHYLDPATCVVLALVLIAMQRLREWRYRGKPSGIFLNRAILAICVIMLVVRAEAAPLHIPLDHYYAPAWYQSGLPEFGRSQIERKLEQMPGQQLVIVRYNPQHKIFAEWVYNTSDIDSSKVVWARELSPEDNQKLIRYFNGRNVWLIEADQKPPRLSPYNKDVGTADSMPKQPQDVGVAPK